MPIRNKVKKFVDGLGITRYRFQKDTGIAPSTAYNLYDNPDWIPQVTALNKICDFYRVQPSELIYWVPPEEIKEDKEDR
ncbi:MULTISPECIES: helix-turn-helix domain-containing protein [Nostoc]|jgi:DNA-binding Xre family transcriptional regulator|uniref:helix-turn-helix domain-containing protein n=1 Tax=Nostoc sphaeroides TaxID=446679 RepID=UPI000E493928|nr:helix-turn-helix transcriptional regulator [Nostoc sphaeroides]MCC5634044.1 helix-turn-helix transcriptional regulator [Nostoc sphaeroides CHAB 2801]